jgi:hypothetical protein
MIWLLTNLWILFPLAVIYMTIWFFMGHARKYLQGRIFLMSFFVYGWCLLYASVGEDVFNWIQRL